MPPPRDTSQSLTLRMGFALWLGLLLTACSDTHDNVALPGVTAATHTAFPITPGTAHALGAQAHDGAVACDSCHAADQDSFRAFSCTGCHEHRASGFDSDTATSGMDAVHAGNDSYRYDSAACLGCHPAGLAAEISRSAHEQYFPIDSASAHGKLGCNECHLGSSRKDVTCTGCHRDDNQDGLRDHDVAAMTAVHGQDMTKLGYTWSTPACLGCHPASQVPGLLSHDSKFPISAGTVHGQAQAACKDCHLSPQDASQLGCIGCHQQVDDGMGPRDVHGEARMVEKHAGGTLPGFAFESASCFLCHPSAQVPGVLSHDRYLPLGAGTPHELGKDVDDNPNDAFPPVTVTCETCHDDPANRKNVSCTGCHAHAEDVLQPTHSLFPDYQWESQSCVFCHLGGQKTLQHPFFPVAQGSSHALDNPSTPTVDGLRCSECHASTTQRTQLSCTSCHRHTPAESTADHGAEMTQFGYSYDSAACFNCHPTSQVPGLFDHEPLYKLLPPSGNGRHAALACADCHADRANRKDSLSCTSCHTPTSTTDSREVHGQPRMAQVHQSFPGYAWSPRICIGCHTDGTRQSALTQLNHLWFPITAGKTHALAAEGGQLACGDCHPTPGDFTRATLGCTTCHLTVDDQDGNGPRPVHGEPRLTTRHQGVTGFIFQSSACLDCHPNGEPTGNINHTHFPITSGSAHQGIDCAQCHLGTGPKTDLSALACVSCHNQTVNLNPTVAQIHNGIPGYEATPQACYNCHPNSEAVGPMNHVAFFPITAGTPHGSANYGLQVKSTQNLCSACHASRTNRTQNLCAECHAQVPSTLLTPPATGHSRVRGFTNTNAGCKACHAEGTPYNLSTHTAFSYSHRSATCQECHSNLTACLANAACYTGTSVTGGKNNLVTTAMRTDKPWAIDFKQYACLKCHEHSKSQEESRHQGKRRNGYTFVSYANPGCAMCH